VSISGGTVILFRLNEEHLWENCTLHVTAFRKAVLAVWDIAGCARRMKEAKQENAVALDLSGHRHLSTLLDLKWENFSELQQPTLCL
jgi:hypothetical protein